MVARLAELGLDIAVADDVSQRRLYVFYIGWRVDERFLLLFQEGRTAVSWAASMGRLEVVTKLAELGADVARADNVSVW